MSQRMKRAVMVLTAVTVVIVILVANRARARHTTPVEGPPAATVAPTAPASSGERPLDRDFKAAMERESAAASGH